MAIQNPVLRGFHPDPSILRVGEDYFIATSTFQWFPGVRIHHSRDLVRWRPLSHALAETRLLDLTGVPDSGGIWAPCLSHDGRKFHLIYTIVRTHRGPFRDVRNYLVTAADIHGPWSDPVFLNASGFDPSLFHDVDGRKWLVNQIWDHRPGRNPFAGIALQEYDPAARALTGPVRNIFRGTSLGLVEGPHLYRIRGWYYLLTAEGGTQYEHAVTVARSRTLSGPYEVDPVHPLLTSWQRPDLGLQKAGHASLVETPFGEFYLAHLCGRPLTALGRCPLGRETALQKCRLTPDGWLRLEGGGNHPRRTVPAPQGAHPFEPPVPEAPGLDPHLCSLRHPISAAWCDLASRPGWIRLRGQESLCSTGPQSLLARRLQAFHLEAETALESDPRSFQHMAGLVFYYDSQHWVYLRVTHEEGLGPVIGIDACDRGRLESLATATLRPGGTDEVVGRGPITIRLRGRMDRERLVFAYALGEGPWRDLGPVLDASRLSDDYVGGEAFTGAFVGICAQDLTGAGWAADFLPLRYREGSEESIAAEGVVSQSRE